MATVRVWNITDDTNPDVAPHNRMVLGKILKPGQAVQVDEARLARAHKLHADVKAGMLYIGPRPPASYLAVKNPPRAKADARRVDDKGKMEGRTAIAPAPGHGHVAEAAAEPVVELADEVKVEEKVEAELKPAEASPATEAPAEEASEDEGSGSSRKRGRRR